MHRRQWVSERIGGFAYMLAALATHTREGGIMRASVNDYGYTLWRSAYPKIGVVHAHTLEQWSLLPVNIKYNTLSGQLCGYKNDIQVSHVLLYSSAKSLLCLALRASIAMPGLWWS